MIKIASKALFTATFLCAFGLLWAQDSGSQAGSATAPDNTKMNQRDRTDTQTADRQSNNSSDLEITRQIRKAIVNDKSLSTNAHNVKVITRQGIVTLRGPVKNEEEKQEIEQKAAQVAGSPDKIHSELEIAGNYGKPSSNPDER